MDWLNLVEVTMIGATVSALFAMGAAIFASYRTSLSGLLGVAMTLTVSALLIYSYPPVRALVTELPFGLSYLIAGFARLTPYALWALAQTLFDDSFRLRGRYLFICAALVILQIFVPDLAARFPASGEPLRLFFIAVGFSVVFHILYVVVRSHRSDLVQSRREFRILFLILTPLAGIAFNVVSSLQAADMISSGMAGVIKPAVILVVTSVLTAKLLMSLPIAVQVQQAPVAAGKVILEELEFSEADRQRLARLERLLKDDKIYREPGLQVRDLAEAMDLPEHNVRQFINSRLGYRNFSSLMNEYRIDEACQRLRDTEQSPDSILQLAFDVGYKSVAPFNKAFRQITGRTPSEYRANPEASDEAA